MKYQTDIGCESTDLLCNHSIGNICQSSMGYNTLENTPDQ